MKCSPEQATTALAAANKVRFDRSKLRKRITAGEVQAWRVIEDPPACVHKVWVFYFLEWSPGLGRERVCRLLRKVNIPSHRTIGSLTDAQRERLVAALRDAHPADLGLS